MSIFVTTLLVGMRALHETARMSGMLEWFRSLLPKEDRFFGLFEQHAGLVVEGAESLRAALKGGTDERHNLRAVTEREQEADAVAHEVLLAVRRSFITPFDRSAITGLISSLDDSIDQMQKTTKSILLLGCRVGGVLQLHCLHVLRAACSEDAW